MSPISIRISNSIHNIISNSSRNRLHTLKRQGERDRQKRANRRKNRNRKSRQSHRSHRSRRNHPRSKNRLNRPKSKNRQKSQRKREKWKNHRTPQNQLESYHGRGKWLTIPKIKVEVRHGMPKRGRSHPALKHMPMMWLLHQCLELKLLTIISIIQRSKINHPIMMSNSYRIRVIHRQKMPDHQSYYEFPK